MSMKMKLSQKKIHQSQINEILRKASKDKQVKVDRQYAETQLKKIYSEQLSKIMSQKKHFLLWQTNQEGIDSQIKLKTAEKIGRMSNMQQKSIQRRQRIINDRLKLYKANDKRWFLKTQAIKQNKKREQISMIDTAKQYRLKTQQQLDMRKSLSKEHMRSFSQKYHTLFSSKQNSSREQSNQSEIFNQTKLQQLIKKRKNRFISTRFSKNIEIQIKHHKDKQHMLNQSRQKQHFQKMVGKLQKIEKIQIKKQKKTHSESIERAKSKLYQKVYKSIRPQIGSPCSKYENKQQKIRSLTIEKQTNNKQQGRKTEYIKNATNRSSYSYYDNLRRKNEENYTHYCQKLRRIKITKTLKVNVRNALTSQFKNNKNKNFNLII